MSALTFDEVTTANVARCDRWHKGGLNDWTVPDWAVAMAGEAGEVCNAVKKLRRVEDALREMLADYMTSETHHPGYVLVPVAAFNKLAALTEA